MVYFPVMMAALDCSSLLSESVQDAITKCRRLGGFNNKHLSLPVLEATKAKVKAPADSTSVESSLLGSQTTIFSLRLYTSERAGELWGVSSIRTLIPFTRALLS